MNNPTKSMIRSLGCRIDDESGKENINCHGSNIQVIRLPLKDMGPHRIRSFCESQTIEISNQVHDKDETRLMHGAMKHQLHCQRQRTEKRLEAKLAGVEPIMVDKKDGSGLMGIGKTTFEKIKGVLGKSMEKTQQLGKQIKTESGAGGLSAAPEISASSVSVQTAPTTEISAPGNGSSAGFSVTYSNPSGG